MNPSYNYTPRDRKKPVYCIGCRQHVPQALLDAGRGLCPVCVAKVQQPQTAPSAVPPVQQPPQGYAQPPRGYAPPAPAPRPPKKPWSKTKKIAVGSGVGAFVVFCIVGQASSNAQAKTDRVTYAPLLTKLQKQHPDKKFALYVQSSEIVPMSAQLTDLRVDKVSLQHTSPSVGADVTFTSTSGQNVKPRIYVSLWDENGTMIGRDKVVNHTHADLAPNATDNTSDTVKIGEGDKPVIVAVDDGPAELKAEKLAQAKKAAVAKAQNAKVAKETKDRGPRPEPSPYDGITPEALAYLKGSLNDADSLKVDSCSPVVEYGKYAWGQRVKYRAKNAFGGYILKEQIFVIKDSKVISVMDYR